MRIFWWVLAAVLAGAIAFVVHAELVHGQDDNRILRAMRTDSTGRPMVVTDMGELMHHEGMPVIPPQPDLAEDSWCLGPCAADGSTTDQIGPGTYKVVWFDEQTRVKVGVDSVGAAQGIVGNPGFESVYTVDAEIDVACRSGGSGHVCFHIVTEVP